MRGLRRPRGGGKQPWDLRILGSRAGDLGFARCFYMSCHDVEQVASRSLSSNPYFFFKPRDLRVKLRAALGARLEGGKQPFVVAASSSPRRVLFGEIKTTKPQLGNSSRKKLWFLPFVLGLSFRG